MEDEKTPSVDMECHPTPSVDMELLESLRAKIAELESRSTTYFASDLADGICSNRIPQYGSAPEHVEEMVRQVEQLDFKPRLNTASYVNVVSEPAERRVAVMGMDCNIADQTVYPASFQLHNRVLNMVAALWHCPKDKAYEQYGCYPGAGTVGSTEACLLAGLALKFRWRQWYAQQHPELTSVQVRGVMPNLVISSMFQAAWEKFFKYMDVEARIVHPLLEDGTLDVQQALKLCNKRTIGVVAILGNHYSGQYDPVWDLDSGLTKLNAERKWQIAIHVDAASGGFVAPWQSGVPAWDFRLPNVLSISASGHKFGESVCGTGWVVWRERKDLSEHVAIDVSYLGGHAASYTLNFSRPATGFYVQFYKFMRLGLNGYQRLRDNQLGNAKFIRDKLKAMKTDKGKPRFLMLDGGDWGHLPVVAAMIHPESGVRYDSVDLQHAVARYHWYVAGYKMDVHNPNTNVREALFCDADKETTMFRVVVKSNLTRHLAHDLVKTIEQAAKDMDEQAQHGLDVVLQRQKSQTNVNARPAC